MNYTGIYEIVNKKNGMIYVGQSLNIKSRFCNHKSSLSRGECGNKWLQDDWDKYGEDAFEFRIAKLIPRELLQDNVRFWLRTSEQIRIKEIIELYGEQTLYNVAYGDKQKRLNK